MAACTFKVVQALFKPVPWSLAMRCAYGFTLRLRTGRTSLKVSGGPGGEALFFHVRFEGLGFLGLRFGKKSLGLKV